MMAGRPPAVFTCMLWLAATDAAMRIVGFRRTLKIARRLARRPNLTMSRDQAEQVLQRIVSATAFYPGRSQCLEQSIVGYVLLRRRGFDAQLKLGVQPYPFFAHAWIELDGVALTEAPDLIASLAPLPELAL